MAPLSAGVYHLPLGLLTQPLALSFGLGPTSACRQRCPLVSAPHPDRREGQKLRFIRAHLFSLVREREGYGSRDWDVLRKACRGKDLLDGVSSVRWAMHSPKSKWPWIVAS